MGQLPVRVIRAVSRWRELQPIPLALQEDIRSAFGLAEQRAGRLPSDESVQGKKAQSLSNRQLALVVYMARAL